MERYFSNAHFVERKAGISNFDQGESDSLFEAWGRFKLLLYRCPNHKMSTMNKWHIYRGFKAPTRMLLDASWDGTLRNKNEVEVKILIENMCQNEYSSSDRIVKPKGVLTVDLNTTILAQLEFISK